MKEIWKPVKGFESKYEISSFGRIKNKKTNHIYRFTNQYGDYFVISLYKNEKRITKRVHRLVAEAFIPNPNNYPCVNHKDLNKQNNRIDNLEWCTYSHNTIDAINKGANTIIGINKYNKEKAHKKYGYIYQYDLSMKYINKYYSPIEASNKTGICRRNILQVINHQEGRMQAGGYIWICEREVVSNE